MKHFLKLGTAGKAGIFLIIFGLLLAPFSASAQPVEPTFLDELLSFLSLGFATETVFLGYVLVATEKLTALFGFTKKIEVLVTSLVLTGVGSGLGYAIGQIAGLGFFADMSLFATVTFVVKHTLISNGSFSWLTGLLPNWKFWKSKT